MNKEQQSSPVTHTPCCISLKHIQNLIMLGMTLKFECATTHFIFQHLLTFSMESWVMILHRFFKINFWCLLFGSTSQLISIFNHHGYRKVPIRYWNIGRNKFDRIKYCLHHSHKHVSISCLLTNLQEITGVLIYSQL